MQVLIKLTRDSHNSYPDGHLVLQESGREEEVCVELGDREVWVNKFELLKAVRILCDE
jgi:hypothetical protein